MRPAHRVPPCRPARRGSAIITVLVLAAVTALIASSLLFRASQEAKLATRSGFMIAALHLAEAGLEEGMHAVSSSAVTTANGWTAISGMTSCSSKAITGLSVSGATGAIYVRVDQSTATAPVIIAAGVITVANQPSVVKQLRLTTSKRSLTGSVLVSKSTITFTDNVDIDSYDSNAGAYNSSSNRSDYAIVGALSTSVNPVVLSSKTDIYGYVSTAGSQPSVGAGGRIYGSTTPLTTAVDTSRIRTDFSANLTTPAAPSGATALAAISANLTLPRAGDSAAASGRYVYSTPSVNLSSKTITVTGAVDLIVTGSYADSGTGSITLPATGSPSLNLYVGGDAQFSGSGIINLTLKPSKANLYGTSSASAIKTYTITSPAGATWYGTIYAPNANMTYTMGKSEFFGSITANSISITGSGSSGGSGSAGVLHYDVQLAGTSSGSSSSGSTTLSPTQWVELSDRPGSGTAFARDNGAPFQNLF